MLKATLALAVLAIVTLPAAAQNAARVEEIHCPATLEPSARDPDGRTWSLEVGGPLKEMSLAFMRGANGDITRIVCAYTNETFVRLDRPPACSLDAPNGDISRIYATPSPAGAPAIIGHINVCTAKAGSPADCRVRCEK